MEGDTASAWLLFSQPHLLSQTTLPGLAGWYGCRPFLMNFQDNAPLLKSKGPLIIVAATQLKPDPVTQSSLFRDSHAQSEKVMQVVDAGPKPQASLYD